MSEIPGAAVRIVEFLNSRGVAFSAGQDRLKEASEALDLCRLFDASVRQLDPNTLSTLRELRSILLAVQESPSDKKARSKLESMARTVSFRPSFQGTDSARWVQTEGNPVVGAVLSDVYELIRSGQWSRIKTCANDACAATFFDDTRSRTQKWHSYALCGNRSNVAAFRSRQA
jgi:predicted RNA-binding Zn ribbon-like protein